MSKAEKSKRFKYKLQTLLKVREIREQQEKDKLAEFEKKLLEELEKEKQLTDIQKEHYMQLRNLMSSGKRLPDTNIILIRKRHIEVLEDKIIAQKMVVLEAESARNLQREKLIKAVKEKKVIEKDREKTKTAWIKLMNKEEVKFLDDIAGIRFNSKTDDSLS
jgi:flagellar FliJ protein